MQTAEQNKASAALRESLERFWGYDKFRPLQEEAMDCVMAHRDSVVVMPTGGGKSLCYQVPATVMDGLAVVVSPLISLMKDQVDALTECGVAAAYINSSLSERQRLDVWNALQANEISVLYVTPERLVQERFLGFLAARQVAFVAIDEAHCVSEWGHDFRPEYRQLATIREAMPSVAIHAYTATATPRVRRDISKALKLRKPEVMVGTFDRPNLIYHVRRRENLLKQVTTSIEAHPGEAGIVYCIRRKDVDSLTEDLNDAGYKVAPYHAGLSDYDRALNQDAFINEQVDIVVATVAFGMGIDKSNVRYVIHAGMPKAIENYHQECGRGGRDGLDAMCYLFYGGNDFQTWRFIMRELQEDAAAAADAKLQAMMEFSTSVSCRHRTLVEYFGDKYKKANCGACDVCLGQIDTVDGAGVLAQHIISGVMALNEGYGGAYTAEILAGTTEQRLRQHEHGRLKVFGVLGQFNRRVIHDWIDQLVSQGYLEKSGEWNVVSVTSRGRDLMDGEGEPQLLKPAEKKRKTKGSAIKEDAWAGVDRALFEALRALRKELAAERSVPPYVVFGDKSLRDMARQKPTSHEAFLHITGVGERKDEQYGEPFLHAIDCYQEEHGPAGAPAAEPTPRKKKAKTNDAAFDLFREDASIADVRSRTGRAERSVIKYLVDFLRSENRTSPEPWVDESVFERVSSAPAHLRDGRLKDLAEYFDGEISDDQINICLACLANAE